MEQQKTGALICRMRKERGMTQRELADRLGVTDKAVSKWERGLSYPDITILTVLAEALGITERELLNGALEGEEEAPVLPDLLVRDTLVYADCAQRERRKRAATVAMALYTAVLVVGAFVCALCDVLLNRGFLWSPIVLAACGLGWAAAAPFYYCRKRKLLWASVGVSLLVPVLLWTIHTAVPASGDWWPQPAMAITLASLALLWVMTLLVTFTRMNRWYVGALGLILAAPLNWYINALTNEAYEVWGGGSRAMQLLSVTSSAVLLLAAAGLLAWLGKRRRARAAS